MAPLNVLKYNVTLVALKFLGAAWALGEKDIHMRNWLLRFL